MVGGGPAGLACAIAASSEGRAVLLLEKMPRAGLKLLASGSGRCNIASALPLDSYATRYGDAGRFVSPALRATDPRELIGFFEKKGVAFVTEGEKIFPASGKSQTVLDALLDCLRESGAELRTSAAVSGIRREDDRFLATSGAGIEVSRALVIATGGASYPRTGSNGEGWALASSLGHSIAETAPALCPIIAANWVFASCAGSSLKNAPIALRREGKIINRSRGDVLFTHRGLSGPGILDLSRYIKRGDRLELSIIDASDAAAVDSLLRRESAAHGARSAKTIVSALGVQDKLGSALLADLGIDPAKKAGDLARAERLAIAQRIAAFPVDVQALAGWDEAMATRGGVSRTEIEARSMGSRLVPGLFFAGEVIDIDGDTGGFNLQAAFSTGFLAGRSASRFVERHAGS
ncbi:MAG: NAD(P)/FAD-dependent oxidoreductase [Spirochaetaceae bacterium]|nr:NAD(P)/FAD-dependent oxidoreductase [Spirochaetaceae bacterium]